MNIYYFNLATFLWIAIWTGIGLVDVFFVTGKESGYIFFSGELITPLIIIWLTYFILRK